MLYIVMGLDEFIMLIELPTFRTPSWIMRLRNGGFLGALLCIDYHFQGLVGQNCVSH